MAKKYDDLTRDELIRLLEAREQRDATRFGLVWEANEIERDKALNQDFVALDLDPALSCGSAPWKNLIVEGDNFDALRYLRMCFTGKVKCIYIDPPYNTGNKDFVYNDHFVDREDLWRHSTWCEFMFQRLTLARDLLAQDGAIFVSIDDNEAAPLRLLMNRVFGERNYGATFIWKKVDSPNDNKVAVTPDHESIICFCMKPVASAFHAMPAAQILDAYGSMDGDRPCRDRLLKKNGKSSLRKDRPTMFFPLIDPDGGEVFPIHDNGEEARWSMGREGIERHRAAGTLIWKKRQRGGVERWEPYTREYAPDTPERPYPTIWADLPTMRQAKAMLRDIFGTADLFSTPKPVELIERILWMSSGPNDIIVDFFAGSGTTAHAVHKLNKEDGGNRRVILVSSTEATVDEPQKNLCRDVCAKRVRAVIEGYGDAPATPGDFAYLRCRRIAPGRLMEIDHAQVWTSLQLMHCAILGQWIGNENAIQHVVDEYQTLIYIPRFRKADGAALKKLVKKTPGVVVYSWQSELIRQELRHCEHVQIESIPQALARRFGMKA